MTRYEFGGPNSFKGEGFVIILENLQKDSRVNYLGVKRKFKGKLRV